MTPALKSADIGVGMGITVPTYLKAFRIWYWRMIILPRSFMRWKGRRFTITSKVDPVPVVLQFKRSNCHIYCHDFRLPPALSHTHSLDQLNHGHFSGDCPGDGGSGRRHYGEGTPRPGGKYFCQRSGQWFDLSRHPNCCFDLGFVRNRRSAVSGRRSDHGIFNHVAV